MVGLCRTFGYHLKACSGYYFDAENLNDTEWNYEKDRMDKSLPGHIDLLDQTESYDHHLNGLQIINNSTLCGDYNLKTLI